MDTNEQNSQNNIDACQAITDSVDDLRRPDRDVPLFAPIRID